MKLSINELMRIRQGLYAEIELRRQATARVYKDKLVTNENAKEMEDMDNMVINECHKIIKRIATRLRNIKE